MSGPVRILICPCGGLRITGSEEALRRLVRDYRGLACAPCGRVMTVDGDDNPVTFAFPPERRRMLH
jgi:hypothetical protein